MIDKFLAVVEQSPRILLKNFQNYEKLLIIMSKISPISFLFFWKFLRYSRLEAAGKMVLMSNVKQRNTK